jgi:hypothetical protein
LAGFRALLVGVAHYADDRIPDLPFVREDLAALDAALTGADYQVTVNPADRTGLAALTATLQSFLLDRAGGGETLLLYLNGHGVHNAGNDYLVPSDALLSYQPFSRLCVRTDVNRDIEHSRAGDVVVFIDACREGFEDVLRAGAKRIGSARWSEGTIHRVRNRKVAYVFSCSTGEYARFVTDRGTGQGQFSVFSRAFATLVADPRGPATLAEFEVALQQRVDEIGRDNGIRPQRVRVLTECDKESFVVVPRGRRELARIGADLDALSRQQAIEADRYARIGPRIANLPAPPAVDVDALRAEAEELASGARTGGWRAADAADLAARRARASAALDAWGRTAAAALAQRDKLRHALEGYVGKAAYHKVLEDPVLRGLHGRVDRILYHGDCDLELAAAALEDFRRALFGRGQP